MSVAVVWWASRLVGTGPSGALELHRCGRGPAAGAQQYGGRIEGGGEGRGEPGGSVLNTSEPRDASRGAEAAGSEQTRNYVTAAVSPG